VIKCQIDGTATNTLTGYKNKAQSYKPEGRGFETIGSEYLSSIYLIVPASLALGITEPLTEMSTRNRNMFLTSKPAAGA
jgi:hypothetical protein